MKLRMVIIVPLISSVLISLFAKFWFNLNTLPFILFMSLSALLSFVGFLFYIVSGFAKSDRDREIEKAMLNAEVKLSNEISTLGKDLLKAQQPEASQQAEMLLKLLNAFSRVVKEKLGSSDIAHSSYISESKRVFNLVRQNLKDALVADISIETVEEKYGDNIPDGDMELVNKQRGYISHLIENNKELLNALKDISVEVANIKDIGSFEYEQSLNRLKELSERAKQFSKK